MLQCWLVCIDNKCNINIKCYCYYLIVNIRLSDELKLTPFSCQSTDGIGSEQTSIKISTSPFWGTILSPDMFSIIGATVER